MKGDINAQRRASRTDHTLGTGAMRTAREHNLLYRRRRMDMIQTFRILKGIDDRSGSKCLLHN